MPRRHTLLPSLFAVLLLVPAARADDAPDPLKGLDEQIVKALHDFDVPGLALAVVKDDKVILARGYGVRKLGEKDAVTEQTLFAIGSCSKAFTAAALGLLVDEGKLKWDDPAAKYLPALQLFDPYVSRELTVRDLLCHRSGLERFDLLWYGSALTRDEVLQKMRLAKPSTSFRSKFGYQNIMFLAAGQIVPSATGKSWDEFVRQRLFTPLGMKASNTSVTALSRYDDVAAPHEKVEDKLEPVPWRNIDNIAPAGSINSSVADMTNWVRLHLNDGKVGKETLLTSAVVEEMRTPQTVIPLAGPTAKLYAGAHFFNYGLGWFLYDYRGKKAVEHGGNIDGMSALVSMLPEEKLGLVVLTNRGGTPLPGAVKNRVFDAFLKAPAKDWFAEVLELVKTREKQAKEVEQKEEKERVKDTKPTLPPEKYAGTYHDDLYGDVRVKREDGKLVLYAAGTGDLSDLEHWHFDTFRARPRDRRGPALTLVTWALNHRGKVESLKVWSPGGGDGLTFKRVPDPAEAPAAVALTEDELRKFVGKYESKSPPVELSVELASGQLKAVVSGQPALTLVPVKPTRFRPEKEPAGLFVEFEVEDGKVKGVKVETPEGPTLALTPKK
jgi:CubicO group peptidase (beta-lactamase class C family)